MPRESIPLWVSTYFGTVPISSYIFAATQRTFHFNSEILHHFSLWPNNIIFSFFHLQKAVLSNDHTGNKPLGSQFKWQDIKYLTRSMTLSLGAVLTGSSLIIMIWSPGISFPSEGPPADRWKKAQISRPSELHRHPLSFIYYECFFFS